MARANTKDPLLQHLGGQNFQKIDERQTKKRSSSCQKYVGSYGRTLSTYPEGKCSGSSLARIVFSGVD